MGADTLSVAGLAARLVSGFKLLTSRLTEPDPVNDVEASLALKLAALRARAMREGIAALRERREGIRFSTGSGAESVADDLEADNEEMIVLSTEAESQPDSVAA